MINTGFTEAMNSASKAVQELGSVLWAISGKPSKGVQIGKRKKLWAKYAQSGMPGRFEDFVTK